MCGNEQSFLDNSLIVAGNIKGRKYSIKDLVSTSAMLSAADSIYTLVKGAYNIKSGRDINTEIIASNALDKEKEKVIEFLSNDITEYLKKKSLIENTKITDPTGIKRDSIIYMKDMCKIYNYIYNEKEDYSGIYSLKDDVKSYKKTVNEGEKRVKNIINTNVFLNPNSKYYNSKVIGLKTGTLKNWNNLCCVYEKNKENRYMILVVGLEDRESNNILTKELIRRIENESISSKSK